MHRTSPKGSQRVRSALLSSKLFKSSKNDSMIEKYQPLWAMYGFFYRQDTYEAKNDSSVFFFFLLKPNVCRNSDFRPKVSKNENKTELSVWL